MKDAPLVLLVEQDDVQTGLVRRAFETPPSPMRLVVAGSVAAARELLAREPVALVVTELVLPDGRGVDLLGRDRAVAPPLVVMTSHGEERMAAAAMKAGALDYLVKTETALSRIPQIAERVLRESALQERQRRIETAFHNTQRILGAVVEAVPALINLKDADSRYLFMNRHQAALYGITPQRAVGRTSGDLLGAEYGARIAAHDAEARAQGSALPYYEEEYRDAHGTRHDLLTTKVPVPGDDGGFPYIATVALDITARKHAERALRTERDRAQSYLDIAGVMLLVLDRDGKVLHINRKGCALLGRSEDAIIGCDWFACFLPPEDAPATRARFDEMMTGANRTPLDLEQDILCQDGTHRTMLWHDTTLTDADGAVLGMLSSGEDISQRRHAEAELEASRQRYQRLYDDNPSMYFTLDRAGTVLSVNRFGAEQLGYRPEDLVGAPAPIVREESVQARLDECFASPGAVFRWEARARHRDGGSVWVRVSARSTPDAHDGDVLLVVCEDITEARSLSEQLGFQASHDALTGLVNRREFEKRLSRVLDTTREGSSEHALCYLDLDQFKIINDTCGHTAGDELLRQLSGLLTRVVRKRDTLARLGGDEFGVLMEHCTLAQAKRVAGALRRAVEGFRFLWEEMTFNVGVSIGLVPIASPGDSVAGVLSAADAACYAAKDGGRNRIHVYHEDDVDLARRYGEMRWVGRINLALEANRFRLYRQPIVPVNEPGQPGLHYELLLRMVDDDGKLVPPGVFLPAAERYGLSTRVDRWVVGAAFDWLAAHPAHVRELKLCSINVSGHSLGDEQFLSFVLAHLDRGVVPAGRLCFEITETAAIANLAGATRFIDALKGQDCLFALDDFGSGLSSFAYLKSLPVDFLKIDGVFVKDIASDPIDLAMVKSINEIGRVMGKRTIAEFVENEDILARLHDIGVDYAQGYLVGRPRPLDDTP